MPRVNPDEGSPKSWLAVLDKVELLKPRYIVPDHGDLGDGSLIRKQRAFMSDLQSRALALKTQGVTAAEAGKRLTAEITAQYSGWSNLNLIESFVDRVYDEN